VCACCTCVAPIDAGRCWTCGGDIVGERVPEGKVCSPSVPHSGVPVPHLNSPTVVSEVGSVFARSEWSESACVLSVFRMAESREGPVRSPGCGLDSVEAALVVLRLSRDGSGTPHPALVGGGAHTDHARGDVSCEGSGAPHPTHVGGGAHTDHVCGNKPCGNGSGGQGPSLPVSAGGDDGCGRRPGASHLLATKTAAETFAVLGDSPPGSPPIRPCPAPYPACTKTGREPGGIPDGVEAVGRRLEPTIQAQVQVQRELIGVEGVQEIGPLSTSSAMAPLRRLSSRLPASSLVCPFEVTEAASPRNPSPYHPTTAAGQVVGRGGGERGGISTPQRGEPRKKKVTRKPAVFGARRQLREAGAVLYDILQLAPKTPLQEAFGLPSSLAGLPPGKAEGLLLELGDWAKGQKREVQKTRDSQRRTQLWVEGIRGAAEGPVRESPPPRRAVVPPGVKTSANREVSPPALVSPLLGWSRTGREGSSETNQESQDSREASGARPDGEGISLPAVEDSCPLSDAVLERLREVLREAERQEGGAQAPLQPLPPMQTAFDESEVLHGLVSSNVAEEGSAAAAIVVVRQSSDAAAEASPSCGPLSVFPLAVDTAEEAGSIRPRAADDRPVAVEQVATPPGNSREETAIGSGVAEEAELRTFAGEPDGYPWPLFLQRLLVTARMNGWADEQTLGKFTSVLEGRALEYLRSLPPSTQDSLPALLDSFGGQFAGVQHRPIWLAALAEKEQLRGETLRELGDDVRRLVRGAYPTLSPGSQECLMVVKYGEAIRSPLLRAGVKEVRVVTLDALVAAAESLLMEGWDRAQQGMVTTTAVVGQGGQLAQGKGRMCTRDPLPIFLALLINLQARVETQFAQICDNANCYNCGFRGHLRGACLTEEREAPAGDRYGKGVNWVKNRRRAEKKAAWNDSRPSVPERSSVHQDVVLSPAWRTPLPRTADRVSPKKSVTVARARGAEQSSWRHAK
jgi:hypothetical protein